MCLASLAATDKPPSPQTNATQANLVFREPFTLKLHLDKEHYYEEQYDLRIPFVASNDIYLFSGESFGVNLGVTNGEIIAVTYQKDKAGADIEIQFKQEIQKDDRPMMMLILKSNIKQVLYLDALMTIPEKKGIYNTSILPLKPGLMSYESWPHPIVQLVLRNLRLKETNSEHAPPAGRGEAPRP